jgi:hypothetical protein
MFPQPILVIDALAGPERRADADTGSGAFRRANRVSVSLVSLGWSHGCRALENSFIFAHVVARVS